MNKYGFSEKYYYKMRTHILIMFFTTIPFFFIMFLLELRLDFMMILFCTGAATIAWGALLIALFLLNWRSIMKSSICINKERIICNLWNKSESILWPEVTKIKIKETLKGNIRRITLYTNHKKTFHIAVFEKMNNILDEIKSNIPSISLITTTREKLDWDNPMVILAVLAFIWFIFIAIRISML
jgi:hypothetical protein